MAFVSFFWMTLWCRYFTCIHVVFFARGIQYAVLSYMLKCQIIIGTLIDRIKYTLLKLLIIMLRMIADDDNLHDINYNKARALSLFLSRSRLTNLVESEKNIKSEKMSINHKIG